MISRNPATGKTIQTFPETPENTVESRLAAADHAYRETLRHEHPDVIAARTRMLRHAATVLEERVEEFSRIMTLEMGKTLASSRAEVLKCAKVCRYYAEHGPWMLKPKPAEFLAGADDGKISPQAEIRLEPLGTILAVMPWNFPFWQVFRCAAPILLSGNSMILKHASNVCGSSLAIEAVFHEACRRERLEPGMFSALLIPASRVEKLIADPRIQGVTLTGSEGAGRKVAAAAGAALKKTVLELGGSDPFVIFPTADLEAAIVAAAESRMLANGQSCIAAKRFLVHESMYERFRRGLLAKFSALRLGDPLDETTTLGPLATAQIREELHSLVEDARTKGARILCGGQIPNGDGYYYPATVIEGIPESAKLYREEAFGPLAALYQFQTHEEMLTIANATPYGLGASIWTKEKHEVELCARRLESGQLFVNGIVASDPGVPFGGMKNSGYGRELGTHGIHEWVIPRTVVTRASS